MRVVIAGGHGKIALILERLLANRGDSVAGLIRNPAHVADLEAAGADALVVDLETSSVEELARHLAGADAVVFAAGAGPGSGIERKFAVDRDAAILLADAAEAAGVRRYLMVSSKGAHPRAGHDAGDSDYLGYLREKDPSSGQDDNGIDPAFAAYLRAKAEADQVVAARAALNTTIVRPGLLTNDPGTGSVTIADTTGPGSIPREDVAAVLLALLEAPATGGQAFDVISGDAPITAAVAARASDGAA
jgi:nucleoside-diphosphate-sugar epimerase